MSRLAAIILIIFVTMSTLLTTSIMKLRHELDVCRENTQQLAIIYINQSELNQQLFELTKRLDSIANKDYRKIIDSLDRASKQELHDLQRLINEQGYAMYKLRGQLDGLTYILYDTTKQNSKK